jgi:poly(A) polymerase Pap1
LSGLSFLAYLVWETLLVANDIINDIKNLKIKNWTSCIQDRDKWKLYVEKAKHSKYEVVTPKEEGLVLSKCSIKILYTRHNVRVHAAWHFLPSSFCRFDDGW